VGIDLRPFSLFKSNDFGLNNRLDFIEGDINNFEFLVDTFKRITSNVAIKSIVCHLAGLSHSGQCQADPLTAYDLNVLQTVKVLEACRKANIMRIVFPSTALVYGENHTEPLTETDTVAPQTIYASTKLAAETVVCGYGNSFGFSCDIARFSNVYGPDCHPDTVVAAALHQASKGEEIVLNNFMPVRDFIYCADAVEGLIRLMATGNEPGCRVFNVSTGIGLSIGQMVETLCRVAGIVYLNPRGSENNLSFGSRLILSNLKLFHRTGWKPSYSLEDGLYETWENIKKRGQ